MSVTSLPAWVGEGWEGGHDTAFGHKILEYMHYNHDTTKRKK